MGLKEFLARRSERSEKFKQMQEDRKLQQTLEEREKSSNERELDKFMKEERETKIKKALESFREKRKREVSQMSVLSGKNIFKGHQSVMSGEATMLRNNKTLLSPRGTNKSKGLFFIK